MNFWKTLNLIRFISVYELILWNFLFIFFHLLCWLLIQGVSLEIRIANKLWCNHFFSHYSLFVFILIEYWNRISNAKKVLIRLSNGIRIQAAIYLLAILITRLQLRGLFSNWLPSVVNICLRNDTRNSSAESSADNDFGLVFLAVLAFQLHLILTHLHLVLLSSFLHLVLKNLLLFCFILIINFWMGIEKDFVDGVVNIILQNHYRFEQLVFGFLIFFIRFF